MTDERWREVDKLFQEALEQEPGDRARFLDRACAGDPSLKEEVEALIRSHEDAGSFLGTPPSDSLIGKNLGPYHVKMRLGSGGMGEVFLAEDTRLGRKVALKTLAPALLSDTQFRARFLREARSVSSLNHPHICTLYDIGQQDGVDYLVMEYLEGESLADRLARGRLPLDQVLRYAAQIADALDKAHRQGITHRDLKPGNIMLTKSGAKLLDFGLAKRKPQREELQEARSLTASGMIVGTLQYMAPEQLEGKETDARTDIFAFGVVLYEMVTGQKAFQGTSQASLMAAILEHEPKPILPLEPRTPGALDHLISVCMAKDPDARWQTASDLARELKWIAGRGPTVTAPATSAIPVTSRRWLVPAVMALLAIGAVVGWQLKRTPAPGTITHLQTGVEPADQLGKGVGTSSPGRTAIATTPDERQVIVSASRDTATQRTPAGTSAITHLQINVEPADQLGKGVSTSSPSRTAIAITPDGRHVIFSGDSGKTTQLYLRRLDQPQASPIPGTEGGMAPFVSPDGQWIGFWKFNPGAGSTILKVPLAGGPPTVVCTTAIRANMRATWAEDNTILFVSEEAISKVSAGGGPTATIIPADSANGQKTNSAPRIVSKTLPLLLPGGKAVIFTIRDVDPSKDQVALQRLDTGERQVLITEGADARYVRTGHLLYMKLGTLMAVPFDRKQLKITGDAIALIENVMQGVNAPNGGDETLQGQFAVSDSGTLLFVPGGIFHTLKEPLVFTDRMGTAQPLPAAAAGFAAARISPDGTRLAGSVTVLRGRSDIWTYDMVRGTSTRLTFEGNNMYPIWSPDGNRLVYLSAQPENPSFANLYIVNATGGGIEKLTTAAAAQLPSSWTAHGNLIAFLQMGMNGNKDQQIWVLPADGDRMPKLFVESKFALAYPEFSPDGHWMTFTSAETGRQEVYVQPYPGPGPKIPISAGGGAGPMWMAGGHELLYRSGLKFLSVQITSLNPFRAELPRLLFESKPLEYDGTAPIRGWDSTPDGQRFLLPRIVEFEDKPATQIQVVLNWTEELKRRVPSGR